MTAPRTLRFLLPGLAIALAACGDQSPQRDSGGARDAVAEFLASHWAAPRQAQGNAPATAQAPDRSLAPARCGACHRPQLEDWRGSLHSLAMGPGVAGQLVAMSDAERDDCRRCHAPLQEQNDPRSPLFSEGLVCAACHMREGRVYGPARRDGSALAAADGMPHGGWTASPAFEDSRFCATCHQFEADGFALNGKLLENTYEEWRASRHAREGRACQGCHMPERRHLWRGIHDPETTRNAITVQAGALRIESGEISATWELANTGAGHFFPTYVTPRVVVSIRQESSNGAALAGTLQEHLIARTVTADLGAELSDTRIAPDEKRVLGYRARRHPRATHLAIQIRVEPDAFYTELYRSLLKEDSSGPGREQIARALGNSLASRYTLHAERRELR